MNILSATEKTGIHTLSLHIVRSIAEQHGGTIERNGRARLVDIIIPEDKKEVCSEEICKQLGAMKEHLSLLLLGAVCGKMILRIGRN